MRDNCLVWQTHTCLSFPTSDRDQHIATYKSFFYVKRLSHAQGTGLKMKKKTKSTTLLYWCNSQQWLLVVSCNFSNLTFSSGRLRILQQTASSAFTQPDRSKDVASRRPSWIFTGIAGLGWSRTAEQSWL